MYQALVDRGLLRNADKDFLAAANRGGPVARIVGSLNNQRITRLAIEPELIGYIREVIRLFDENKHLPEAGKSESNPVTPK